MDQKTQDYYRKNARKLLKQYHQVKEKGVSVYFDRAFADCKAVLDIGCGVGQDLLHLLERGYDAYGLEPCEELIRATVERYPQLSGRILTGSLPSTVENLKNKKFDAVLCSAVLMHIPEEDLFDSVYTIRNLLEDRGKLLISIPNSRGDHAETDRDTAGRLMIMRNPWDIQLLFERTGFQLIDYWENDDSIKRKGIRWTTMLFSYREEHYVRPIDKIEGKRLKTKFDVDHAIPFSLWMNNDLWNLFPISPLVNNSKRDKLPTSNLVKKRRTPIIDYWRLMRSEMTPRFDYEMERFTGLLKIEPFNWENKLFSHFIEAIEYTAIQRGIERWEP